MDTKEKSTRGLVRLIEEWLEGTLKGTKAAKNGTPGGIFGTNNGTYTYAFLPSLEAFDEKA